MKNCDELEMARAKLIAALSGNVPSPFQPEAEPMLCNMVNVLSWVLGYDVGEVIAKIYLDGHPLHSPSHDALWFLPNARIALGPE